MVVLKTFEDSVSEGLCSRKLESWPHRIRDYLAVSCTLAFEACREISGMPDSHIADDCFCCSIHVLITHLSGLVDLAESSTSRKQMEFLQPRCPSLQHLAGNKLKPVEETMRPTGLQRLNPKPEPAPEPAHVADTNALVHGRASAHSVSS